MVGDLVQVYASGNFYDGDWKDNRPHGSGLMVWHTRSEAYTGEWAAGAPHGRGEHVWYGAQGPGLPFQTLNRYRGEWSAGRRHGRGEFEYADGSRYDGAWDAGRKEGLGEFHYPDGSVFRGAFAGDRPAEGQRSRAPLVGSNAADVALFIGDLLAESDGADAELRLVSNLLLQVRLRVARPRASRAARRTPP